MARLLRLVRTRQGLAFEEVDYWAAKDVVSRCVGEEPLGLVVGSDSFLKELGYREKTGRFPYEDVLDDLALSIAESTGRTIMILVIHYYKTLDEISEVLYEEHGFRPLIAEDLGDKRFVAVFEKPVGGSSPPNVMVFLAGLPGEGLGGDLTQELSEGGRVMASIEEHDIIRLWADIIGEKNGSAILMVGALGGTYDATTQALGFGGAQNPKYSIRWGIMPGILMAEEQLGDLEDLIGYVDVSVRMAVKVYSPHGDLLPSHDPTSDRVERGPVAMLTRKEESPLTAFLVSMLLSALETGDFFVAEKAGAGDPRDIVIRIYERHRQLLAERTYLSYTSGSGDVVKMKPLRPLLGVGYSSVSVKVLKSIAASADRRTEATDLKNAVKNAIRDSLSVPFGDYYIVSKLLGHDVIRLDGEPMSLLSFSTILAFIYPVKPGEGWRPMASRQIREIVRQAVTELGIERHKFLFTIWVPLRISIDMPVVHVLALSLLSPLQVIDAFWEAADYKARVRTSGGYVYPVLERMRAIVKAARIHARDPRFQGYYPVVESIRRRFFGIEFRTPDRRAPFGRPHDEVRETPQE